MQSIDLAGVNQCHSSGLLTATGAETVYDTTVQIDFSINGIMYSLATVAGGTTPTTDANAAALDTLTASEGCVMVWCLNAAGTVGVFQSRIYDLDSDGNFPGIAPEFPIIDNDWVPFAYQILKAGSTAGTITFGSSNWNATGFTNSIKNLNVLPSRPQIA